MLLSLSGCLRRNALSALPLSRSGWLAFIGRLTSSLPISWSPISLWFGFRGIASRAENLKLIKRSADPSCSTIGEYAVKLRQVGPPKAQLSVRTGSDLPLRIPRPSDPHATIACWPSACFLEPTLHEAEASLAKWKDHTQVQCYCYLMPLLRAAAPPSLPNHPEDKGGHKGPTKRPRRTSRRTIPMPRSRPAAATRSRPGLCHRDAIHRMLTASPCASHSILRATSASPANVAAVAATCAGTAWSRTRHTNARSFSDPLLRQPAL